MSEMNGMSLLKKTSTTPKVMRRRAARLRAARRPRLSGRPVVAALLLVTALLVGAVLSGCGGSGVETSSTAASTTVAPPTTAGPASSGEPGSTSQAGTSISAPATRVEKLTLVAPPGPMAIPLAYVAVNEKLADVAEKTELVIWENADQLKAYVGGKQADFVTMPSNNAAIFYNKGLPLKLLDISVWNITYLITRNPDVRSFADIKDQTLTVPFQGSVPDLMFQYIAKAEGLDPQKDFMLRYATDPTQASQLLLSGQVDNAVLSEALATAVILQTQSADKPLHRAFAFDTAWQDVAGDSNTPIAGTVATAAVLDKPEVVQAFEREYQAAVQWMLDNPEEAGKLVETRLPQLGLKAAVMTASLKNITWRYTAAADARASLEGFYQTLSELSPEVIGDKLPDDGFYFEHTP